MIAISVIVPALNAAATIGRTLEALAGQDLAEPYEVIVVDDKSDDDTVAIAEAAPGAVSVLRQDRSGAGAGRNRGAVAARAGALAFTDADCIPTPGWLREGLAALGDADFVQGAVRPDPAAPRRPFDRTLWVVRESGLYESANLFISRELLLRLGGFEDWLGTDGRPFGDDVWLGWRARRAGARTAFCERALVHHAVFRRSVGDYVSERRRLAFFPALAKKIPELRDEFLYRRWFLNRRSAAFDAAVVGVAAAMRSSSMAPLVAVAPYAWLAAKSALPWRRHAPKVAAVELLCDGVGFGALLWGSARSRSPVL